MQDLEPEIGPMLYNFLDGSVIVVNNGMDGLLSMESAEWKTWVLSVEIKQLLMIFC